MTAEFAINNKTHLVTDMSLFIVNYGRELRMGADIRRKGKVEKAIKDIRGNRSSNEEGTGGDKVASG